MKVIINGNRYDTEQAILIGDAEGGGLSNRNWSRWEAGLDKPPRSGASFLAGNGGPMSLFRRNLGEGRWANGSGIIPLSDEEALKWAEEHLRESVIEEHVGIVIEDA